MRPFPFLLKTWSMRMRFWWAVTLALVVNSSWADEAIRGLGTVDGAKLRKQQGVEGLIPSSRSLKNLKIVVIDKSFSGFVEGSGQLPDSTKLYETYHFLPKAFQASLTPDEKKLFELDQDAEYPDNHGLDLAKAHWAMMGGFPEGPQYALVVARTVTEIRRAAKFADWWDARMVICAQNIPAFGNRDGLGEEYDEIAQYLNRDPRRFWVNSAGNYERFTHTTNVRLDNENRVIFKNGKSYLRLKMRIDGSVLITAAWNEFSKRGSDKNIDLYLLDEDGRTVYSYERRRMARGEKAPHVETVYAQSEMVQHVLSDRPQTPPPPAPGITNGAEAPTPLPPLAETEDELIPSFEEISVPLKKNSEGQYYYIELHAKGGRLSAQDEVRVVVRPDSIEAGLVPDDLRKAYAPSIELLDWTSGNNVYFPADYKDIITAGELSNNGSRGLTANGVAKPDAFLSITDLVLSNGRSQSGTSSNTFVLAGHIGLLAALYPEMTRVELRRYLSVLDSPPLILGAKDITTVSSDSNTWKNQHLPYLRNQYPGLFDILAENSGDSKIRAVGQDQNRMYHIGYEVSPASFRGLFSAVPAEAQDEYEYYLAFWQEEVEDNNRQKVQKSYYQPLTRKRRTDSSGEEEAYPWLREDVRAKNPAQYVRVRRLFNKDQKQAIRADMKQNVGRVWKVPSDEDQRRYFGTGQ